VGEWLIDPEHNGIHPPPMDHSDSDNSSTVLITSNKALYIPAQVFAWLISHQPAVLFSHNKPATSNQPTVFFSQNKPAPATSQTNRLTPTET
jgi:hypothetical protein